MSDSNRTQVAESALGCGGFFTTTASYTYDPGVTPGVDQLTSVTTGSTTSSYGYTADGQVKSYGTANTISWDGWQRTSGGSFSGTTVAYHYDPLGGLLSRSSSGGNTTGYLLGDLVETNSAGAITTSYVDGPDGDLAEYAGPPATGSTVDYLYYNGHGDLAAEADSSGTRAALHTYDPFGAPLDTQPSDQTAHRYTGAWAKQYDTASDLVLMGARPYDPSLGRFLAVDPIDGGSLNNYDYAGQDPINSYDLDGLSIVEEGMSSGGVISGSNSPLSCINELAWEYQWRCEGESSGPSSHPSAKSVWKEVKTLAAACGSGAFTSGLVASETGAGAVGAAAVGCVTSAVIEAVKQVNRPAGDVLEIVDVARNVREIVDTKDGIVFEVRISHAHGRTTTTISQSRGR